MLLASPTVLSKCGCFSDDYYAWFRPKYTCGEPIIFDLLSDQNSSGKSLLPIEDLTFRISYLFFSSKSDARYIMSNIAILLIETKKKMMYSR